MSKFEQRERPIIEIFEATPEDAAGIIAVQKETWLDTYPNEEYGITKEDILSRDWDSPNRIVRWQKMIAEHGDMGRMWIAKEGERVIGFCSATKDNDQNRIRAIYVLPEYQKEGVGRKLIDKAFDWLGDNKDSFVAVAKYNANAIHFYKRMGFEGEAEVPPSPAGQLPTGKTIPEVEMIRPHKKSEE